MYNKDDKYLGCYHVVIVSDLPKKIENNLLIFTPYEDCTEITKISFKEGIPKQLYVLCTSKLGDLFYFSAE